MFYIEIEYRKGKLKRKIYYFEVSVTMYIIAVFFTLQ
jgi:hypothetical protein